MLSILLNTDDFGKDKSHGEIKLLLMDTHQQIKQVRNPEL